MRGGDQEVAGGEQPGLVHPLAGGQVHGAGLGRHLLQLLHRGGVLLLVLQAEHVARVLVQLRPPLGEVDVLGLGRRLAVARVVDVVDQTVLQVGGLLLEARLDGVQLVGGGITGGLRCLLLTVLGGCLGRGLGAVCWVEAGVAAHQDRDELGVPLQEPGRPIRDEECGHMTGCRAPIGYLATAIIMLDSTSPGSPSPRNTRCSPPACAVCALCWKARRALHAVLKAAGSCSNRRMNHDCFHTRK